MARDAQEQRSRIFIFLKNFDVHAHVFEHFEGHLDVGTADHAVKVQDRVALGMGKRAQQSGQDLAASCSIHAHITASKRSLDNRVFARCGLGDRHAKRTEGLGQAVEVSGQQTSRAFQRQRRVVQGGQHPKHAQSQSGLSRGQCGVSGLQREMAVDGHGIFSELDLRTELRGHHQCMGAVVRFGRARDHRPALCQGGQRDDTLHDALARRGPHGVARQGARKNAQDHAWGFRPV